MDVRGWSGFPRAAGIGFTGIEFNLAESIFTA